MTGRLANRSPDRCPATACVASASIASSMPFGRVHTLKSSPSAIARTSMSVETNEGNEKSNRAEPTPSPEEQASDRLPSLLRSASGCGFESPDPPATTRDQNDKDCRPTARCLRPKARIRPAEARGAPRLVFLSNFFLARRAERYSFHTHSQPLNSGILRRKWRTSCRRSADYSLANTWRLYPFRL